jgi:hypothetical protein
LFLDPRFRPLPGVRPDIVVTLKYLQTAQIDFQYWPMGL